MEAVDGIAQSAAALSSYGFNVICACLAFVVWHLYKRLNALEKEFRNSLMENAKTITKANETLETLAKDSLDTIKQNSECLGRVEKMLG